MRHEWSGYWSRRINEEHRLIYKAEKGVVFIAACRYHYGKLMPAFAGLLLLDHLMNYFLAAISSSRVRRFT